MCFRNEAKDRVITQEEFRRLQDACPCQEWRVIITLARIGGLHPCEIPTLRWQDIDKEKHRLYAFASRTLSGKSPIVNLAVRMYRLWRLWLHECFSARSFPKRAEMVRDVF